jgi:hypothetical protein
MNKLSLLLPHIIFKDQTVKFHHQLDLNHLLPSTIGRWLLRTLKKFMLTPRPVASRWPSVLDLSGLVNDAALYRMRHLDRFQRANWSFRGTGSISSWPFSFCPSWNNWTFHWQLESFRRMSCHGESECNSHSIPITTNYRPPLPVGDRIVRASYS